MANRLSGEYSLYLRQHALNPVDWYPWGDAPFLRAAAEDKPVLISIGYAACHWCHVMERESFEDPRTAAFMNSHFICVKVDREEHPEVDHFYMDAVQAISGRGGWPLNVFVTPSRIPFYGGTYFPPAPVYGSISWMQLLERIQQLWQENKGEIFRQEKQMRQYLAHAGMPGSGSDPVLDKELCAVVKENLLRQADRTYGGFGGAPKFPATMALGFLLEHSYYNGDQEALDHALKSLDAMLAGGIRDHLGGGFARYATDREWNIPHFEKMLYDNALLMDVLCDAWQITRSGRYAEAVAETHSFLNRELKDPSGLYYSALDADSEGVEGKFYTWTEEEWMAAAGKGEEESLARAYFGITASGNWEHTNILYEARSIAALQADTGIPEAQLTEAINQVKHRLFRARSRRERPQTDDKCLLSWNALLNLALVKASALSGMEHLMKEAVAHMEIMLTSFHKDGMLNRVWKEGKSRIEAGLGDYALLIQALIRLGAISGRSEWIALAHDLCQKVQASFLHEDGTGFYLTSVSREDIPVRKTDWHDGSEPSSNAWMASNLLLLASCMGKPAWREQAIRMMLRISEGVKRYPQSFSYWAILIQRFVLGMKTVVVTGPETFKNISDMSRSYCPHAFFIASEKEIFDIPILYEKYFPFETLIFVCAQDTCLPPVTDPNAASALL